MELKSLNTFIHVAELGSFYKAGELLGYSQPTVSVQIKQLEDELGEKLFDRVGHTIRLTDRGRETLHYAQSILQICQKMSGNTSNAADEHTTVRIATAHSLCSPITSQVFGELQKHHPNISLKISTAGTDDLFRFLDNNEVDLVCTLDNHYYNSNYVIAAEEQIGVHFVVSVHNPLTKKEFLTKKDLMTQNFLLTERGMSYRRLLDEWMAHDSMQIQPVLEAGSADLLCLLVEQGIGISFLPDYVTEDAVQRGTVVRLDAEGFHPELWMQLLHHKNKWISRSIQAVIDILIDISL